jgi:phage terminase Nu1 subunit (DNA packaging protein)
VDRDKSNVSRWLKRPDWPFSRTGPWQRSEVPEILRWIADSLISRESVDDEDGDDDYTELKKEKLRKEIRKLHAQADAAETALAKERGKLLDAADVERKWASIGAVVRNAFQNLSSQLVPLALGHGMPNEAAPQFQEQVDAAVGSILRHLSDDDGESENTEGGGEEVLQGDTPAGEMDSERVGGELPDPDA